MDNLGIVRPSICPYCGYLMDNATGIQDRATPKESDISICLKCTGVMVFDEDLALQGITSDVWASLPSDIKVVINKGIVAILATR